MSTPKPQSDDWFFWDPQTIHKYPSDIEPIQDEASPDNADLDRLKKNARLGNGWWRELVLSLVAGVVAAVVLSMVVMMFPSSTRAATHVDFEGTDSPAVMEKSQPARQAACRTNLVLDKRRALNAKQIESPMHLARG